MRYGGALVWLGSASIAGDGVSCSQAWSGGPGNHPSRDSRSAQMARVPGRSTMICCVVAWLCRDLCADGAHPPIGNHRRLGGRRMHRNCDCSGSAQSQAGAGENGDKHMRYGQGCSANSDLAEIFLTAFPVQSKHAQRSGNRRRSFRLNRLSKLIPTNYRNNMNNN